MQTGEDGEYIPSKELNTNFKIPKKKQDSNSSDVPLYNSVVNENPTSDNTKLSYNPPAAPPILPIQATIVQNIQKREYEKPKTYENHILRETIPDCFDETLPRSLTSLFQPLYCKLCAAQLSSNIVAKLHYKSKNHEKKIRKFLTEHSLKTGAPLHARAKLPAKSTDPSDSDESNPLYFYCDICDLPLTGKLHAESHYLGKNHRKATLGVKTPAGKGHFDNGKWVRQAPKRPLDADDGFGADFRSEHGPQLPPGFRCDLCGVTTTCGEQLEAHYLGQKHRKKLKLQANEHLSPVSACVSPESCASVAAEADAKLLDCSAYRTPSGQYYCHICNSSNNSEAQFRQHLQSRNHLKKSAAHAHQTAQKD